MIRHAIGTGGNIYQTCAFSPIGLASAVMEPPMSSWLFIYRGFVSSAVWAAKPAYMGPTRTIRLPDAKCHGESSRADRMLGNAGRLVCSLPLYNVSHHVDPELQSAVERTVKSAIQSCWSESSPLSFAYASCLFGSAQLDHLILRTEIVFR